jgi:hypothetical protein
VWGRTPPLRTVTATGTPATAVCSTPDVIDGFGVGNIVIGPDLNTDVNVAFAEPGQPVEAPKPVVDDDTVDFTEEEINILTYVLDAANEAHVGKNFGYSSGEASDILDALYHKLKD